jgi:hypothetical protein
MGDSTMTVSGLGGTHSPRMPLVSRPRPLHTKKEQPNAFDLLTGDDRQLILEATGQRVGPGFDPVHETTTSFATALAAERAAGHLAPGQPVTAVYLKDLNRRFERAGGANPLQPYLGRALDYLSRSGPRRIDVTA